MKVDSRVIMKKTGCTAYQAKYLAEEIRKLPKVKDIIMEHIGEVNLFGCCKVEVIRMFGYRDDWVKISGCRLPRGSRLLIINGKDFTVYDRHLWTFGTLFPEERFYQII